MMSVEQKCYLKRYLVDALVVSIIIMASVTQVRPQQPSSSLNPDAFPVSPAVTDSSETLALEERKLLFEREKFNFEKSRHSDWQDTWVPALSVSVPLLLGVITLVAQGRNARKLQQESARNALELKALEIVLSSSNTGAGLKRAKLMNKLFPDIFPATFVELFNDSDALPGVRYIDMKMELAKVLAENLGNEREILQRWRMIFHDENWINYLIDKWREAYPDEAWVRDLQSRTSPERKSVDANKNIKVDGENKTKI